MSSLSRRGVGRTCQPSATGTGTEPLSGPGEPQLEGAVDPDQYIVGPGDRLLVELWGLHDVTTVVEVNAEGRLLYDLQKVCVYHEREIYSVNVMDYLIDLGKRPLKRPQAGQRLVLILKALRSALRRTNRARLSPHGRAELQRLLHAAIRGVENRLREFLRGGVNSAVKEGGLHPTNAAETVARDKLTEEMLEFVSDPAR